MQRSTNDLLVRFGIFLHSISAETIRARQAVLRAVHNASNVYAGLALEL